MKKFSLGLFIGVIFTYFSETHQIRVNGTHQPGDEFWQAVGFFIGLWVLCFAIRLIFLGLKKGYRKIKEHNIGTFVGLKGKKLSNSLKSCSIANPIAYN